MPSWWMPEWCANALAPTTALLGCTSMPVSCDTSREVRYSCEWSSCVATPYTSRMQPGGHRHLLERGVAGALADAVDARLDLARPAEHADQRVGGGEPEVVVAVHESTTLRSAGTCSYIHAISARHSSGVA